MLDIIKEAALKAGAIHRKYFRQKLEHKEKSAYYDFVTEVDIKSQRVIVEAIEHGAKKLGILQNEIGYMGEEDLQKEGKYIFVIDPLDGTSDFSAGLDFFGILIGVYVDRVLTYGVIYQPVSDILTYAEKGKGAFIEEKGIVRRLRMTKTDPTKMFYCGSINRNKQKRIRDLKLMDMAAEHFMNVITLHGGAPILSSVAEDTMSVFVDSGVGGLWDIAPGILIIEEAGGVFKDWNGNDLEIDLQDRNKKYAFVACHPKILPLIVGLIRKTVD